MFYSIIFHSKDKWSSGSTVETAMVRAPGFLLKILQAIWSRPANNALGEHLFEREP